MSVNISKQKRERLIAKIKAIKKYIAEAPQDENTAQLLTYVAEIEKDIKGKKYGLVFEEHREAIDELLETHTPVLTEEKDLFIDNGGQMNFLIEGDNLASLQLLEKTHKVKIDIIYIDPPYNTGNRDFIYDDDYICNDDSYRHSKWLSFMEKRLFVAKRLLSAKGIVFISIDDIELANIICLCNEIFNEDNFIGLFTRNSSSGEKTSVYNINKNQDYVLVYCNNSEEFKKSKIIKGVKKSFEGFSNPDNDPKGSWKKDSLLIKIDGGRYGYARYGITNPYTNVTYYPPVYYDETDRRQWHYVEDTFNKFKEEGRVVFEKKEKKSGYAFYIKKYLSDVKKEFANINSLFLISPEYQNTKGTKSLKEIFEKNNVFSYSKPVSLIQDLTALIDNSKACVLDFFAGSGTTGHAVMKLNAQDGGKRKFILCTNNENNICRNVTYERIKRVIDKEKYSASLKYFKVDYLPISDKLYYEYADELLKHIKELVELENGVNFDGNAEIAIILTEAELDAFTASLSYDTDCKAIYLGHDVLTSEAQEKLFKKYNIAINVIPDYYYKDLEG
ncbi:MAG: site-specific DNA-methyltransferase [Corallococcus sp.]|nr:site-specific DNA-methyltransferase [Corallococcus sp.]